MPDDFYEDFSKAFSILGQSPARALGLARGDQHLPQPIQAEKVRPEFRHADLSDEEVAVVQNLAATAEQLGPDRSFAARDLVERLLTALKPAERLVIDLLYLQQRSVAEIQALTGWGASLVKVRAFRARQKMKQQLAQFGAEGSR